MFSYNFTVMSSHEMDIVILQFEGELNIFQVICSLNFRTFLTYTSVLYKQQCKFLHYPKKVYLERQNELDQFALNLT